MQGRVSVDQMFVLQVVTNLEKTYTDMGNFWMNILKVCRLLHYEWYMVEVKHVGE